MIVTIRDQFNLTSDTLTHFIIIPPCIERNSVYSAFAFDERVEIFGSVAETVM